MSGYPNQPPVHQVPFHPQYYNPANAPPPQNYPAPGYPAPGQPAPGTYPYQPGFAFGQPGQPPSAMSYPGINPTPVAPSAPGYGYNPMYPSVNPAPFGQAVEWIPTTPREAPSLMDRAVVAGYEGHDGSPLWVIRSRFQGDLIPGKLAVKHHVAYVAWGGNENAVQNIEVCCARPERIMWTAANDGVIPAKAIVAGNTANGEPLYCGRAREQGSLTPGKVCCARPERIMWTAANDGVIPAKAIVAGNTANGEPLYCGRAREQGSLTPGKVHPSHKVLYISFAGREIPHKAYEIMCLV